MSKKKIDFYLRYIEPNQSKIAQNFYKDAQISQLPAWSAMMGLQLESLLLQNRPLLLQSMGINPVDCVADNPFFQRATQHQKGCQIDYLVQTRAKNIFVCEFKFTKRELDTAILTEVSEKIKRLVIPKGYAAVPVLFHVGGVSDSVVMRDYFYRIIDIGDFL